jgi:hypothetical protein
VDISQVWSIVCTHFFNQSDGLLQLWVRWKPRNTSISNTMQWVMGEHLMEARLEELFEGVHE